MNLGNWQKFLERSRTLLPNRTFEGNIIFSNIGKTTIMIAKMNWTDVPNQSTTNNQNVAAVKNVKNTHGK